MQILTYRFSGISPLLMSSIQSVGKTLPALKIGTQPNDGDLEKVAEAMAYRDDDGSLYVPTAALRSSLLSGCTGQKIAGSRTGPAKLFQATIFEGEDRSTLVDSDGAVITDYAVQVDSGVNGSTKARVLVVRPRIDDWHINAAFELDDEFAPSNIEQFLDSVLTIWNRAGRAIGVGAWRPQCKGRYGRYSVELVSRTWA